MVETDKLEVPEPCTDAALKLALAPVGNPLTLRLTFPVKPPDGVTVVVYEVTAPAVTVCEAGVGDKLKFAAEAPQRSVPHSDPFTDRRSNVMSTPFTRR